MRRVFVPSKKEEMEAKLGALDWGRTDLIHCVYMSQFDGKSSAFLESSFDQK